MHKLKWERLFVEPIDWKASWTCVDMKNKFLGFYWYIIERKHIFMKCSANYWHTKTSNVKMGYLMKIFENGVDITDSFLSTFSKEIQVCIYTFMYKSSHQWRSIITNDFQCESWNCFLYVYCIYIRLSLIGTPRDRSY